MRNDLKYWYPKLVAAKLPTPRTAIVETVADLSLLLDGEEPELYRSFMDLLRAEVCRMGLPCFLRTGQTSNKHDWKDSCYVTDIERLPQHVANLVEFSACVDILGMPTNTWVVREFLKLKHDFHAFNGMPVALEYRAFIRDGKILCFHSYWPEDSIRNPSRPDWQELLHKQNTEPPPNSWALFHLLQAAAWAFNGDGAWSVDAACTADGNWLITDMAEMERSYHWKGCKNDPHPEIHEKPKPTEDPFLDFIRRQAS